MKRPFATIGFTSFTVMLFSALVGRDCVAFYACICFFVAGCVSLSVKNFRQTATVPVCFFTAVFVCLLFIGFNEDKEHTQSLTGSDVTVTATVSEAPYIKKDKGRYYCVLDIEAVGGEKAKGKLRLSFSPSRDGIDPESLEIGNKISFRGTVYIPGENEKSISRYFTGENILLGAYGAREFSFEEPSFRGVNFYFHKIRSFVTDTLCYGFGDRIAGLLVGVLTGDKSCLDEGLYDAFRETGVAHMMAVSGLHLSVWVFSLGSLIGDNRRWNTLKYGFLIFAVLFVMLLAGMSESVKRAGFMCIVFLIGKLSKRRSDSLNSLGFAVFVMILFNPACVLSISLQLSFLSTLGMLTLGQLYIKRGAEIFGGKDINTPVRKLLRYCTDVFFISISVLVFTFPVLIYNFGGISTVSAWVNILLSPVITPLLLLAGVYVVVSRLFFAAFPVAVIVELASEYMILITRSFTRVKNAFLVFDVENLPLYLSAAVLILFLSVAFLKHKGRGKAGLVLSAVAVSVCLIAFYECRGYEGVKIHLADYEGEIAVAVEKDSTAFVCDKLPSYEMGLFVSYLEEKGAETVAFIDGEGVYCTADGKEIYGKAFGELFEGISLYSCGEGKIIEADGKYIYLFSSETLQKTDSCDIMIKMCESGAVISIADKSFSLPEGGEMTLILKDNLIVRGENSWRNLMKSS